MLAVFNDGGGMPDNRPHALRAFDDVLAGRVPGLPRIPFSADPEVIEAARITFPNIVIGLRGLTHAHLERLAAKYLAHLNKAGIQDVAAITRFSLANFMELIAAIRSKPDALFTNVSITGLLRGHRQRELQNAARLKKHLSEILPPRKVLWQSGSYRIEEATDPRHLIRDSFALGHGAGTLYNEEILTRLRITSSHPEALHYIHYWIALRKGRSRILTLTSDGVPLVTMEYLIKAQTIDQLSARRQITGSEHFFKPMCRALADLRHTLPLSGIADLVQTTDKPLGTVITPEGDFEKPDRANLTSALAGLIDLTNDDVVFNAMACNNPLLDVSVAELTQNTLSRITRVAGGLLCVMEDLDMPNLTHIGRDLYLPLAASCNIPRLRTIGRDFIAECLIQAMLPELTTVGGSFECPDLECADLANLQSIGRSTKKADFIKSHTRTAEDRS